MPDYSFWVLVCMILLLLAWIGLSLRRNRQLKKQLTVMKEAQYGEIIRALDHHRHDWMNDVQVLFGYIQLNKQEKLKTYTNNMINQIQRESLISKLGIPFLVAYIISFRANSNALILDVKLEEEINLIRFGEQGTRVARLIIVIVEAYKSAAGYGEGDANQLSITMNEWGGQLSIGFEYDGTSDIDDLNDKIQVIIERMTKHPDIEVTIENTEQAIDLEVQVRLTGMAG